MTSFLNTHHLKSSKSSVITNKLIANKLIANKLMTNLSDDR